MNGINRLSEPFRSLSAWVLGIGIAISLIGIAQKASAGTPGYIDTYAGGGPKDGVTAVAIGLNAVKRVTADRFGNVYFTTSDHQLWKIKSDGTMKLLAGNRTAGSDGDGSPATSAMLSDPNGIAVNSDGDLFIADSDNNKIRKVDHSTGIITTVAGNGTAGSDGDGDPAILAQLNYPTDVAVNTIGDLFIADIWNNKIRMVDHSSGVITTYAGTGSCGTDGEGGPAAAAQLCVPNGVAFDSDGDLFVTDSQTQKIRKIDHSSGFITTYAGSGSQGSDGDGFAATSAQFFNPGGIAFNASDDLFIADVDNEKIRRVDHTSKIITTVAGAGTQGSAGDGGDATFASLNTPVGVAVIPSGDLLIADSNNKKIRKVDASTGDISTYMGTGSERFGGDGNLASFAQLSGPTDIVFNSSGDLIISDNGNDRIRKVDHLTGIISTIAGAGNNGSEDEGVSAASARLKDPYGIAFAANGDLYYADSGVNKIRKIDHATGLVTTVAGTGVAGYSGDEGPATAAELRYPTNIAFNSDGDLFLVDAANCRIRKVDQSTGIISTYAGNGTPGATGDAGPAVEAQLFYPFCIAIDKNDNLFIADSYNNKIRKVDHATGIITTFAGTGASDFDGDGGAAVSAKLSYPFGVGFDANDDLIISDGGNSRIRKVDHATGIISTVAGSDESLIGDGASALSAQLNSPTNVAFDTDGDLYIADQDNKRIRIVYQTSPDTTPPSVSVGFGSSYSDSNGASYAGYGHSYIRIVSQDRGAGYDSLSVTSATNALPAIFQEKIGASAFVAGASGATTNPVYAYFVKEDDAKPASFTFSVCDKKANYGAPSLKLSSLSFAKKGQVSRSFDSVAKEQGQVSILANSGDLRNAFVVANGETIEIGDVPAGAVRTVDLRSRLRAGTDNAISLTATGDAGASATALVSSATLDRIDEAEESAKRVYRRGDANEDGRIDVRDAAKLLRILTGIEMPSATERALCDIDLDGSLTAADAIGLLRIAAGR